MNDILYLEYVKLIELVTQIFLKTGICEEHSLLAANSICSASLRGVDSHGIRLLPHYVESIRNGRVLTDALFEFNQTSVSTGCFDANHGIAHAAMAKAVDFAVGIAKKTGVGMVSVKNSNHCGAMAFYAMRACEKDMIGLAFTNASPKLKTFNSRRPFFGINPICFAAPMAGEGPLCYDSAPSIMSSNKIKMFLESGEKLPHGVAADVNGFDTIVPDKAKMLLPIGGQVAGYKGLGLAMIVDILCSLLTGMPNGNEVSAMYDADGGDISSKRLLGQFVVAIDISVFEDVAVFKKRLAKTANAIRVLPKTGNLEQDVMVPGDPEKKIMEKRMVKGIPVKAELYDFLITVGG